MASLNPPDAGQATAYARLSALRPQQQLESATEFKLRQAMRESIRMTCAADIGASMRLPALHEAALQLRLVAMLLAGSMIFTLLDPAALLWLADESLLYRVAASTSVHPQGMALIFCGLAALLTPYLLLQCGTLQEHRRGVVKLTCAGLALAAVLWAFLSWRSVHLDLGTAAPLLFARNGVGALLFAFVLAASLNAERLRAIFDGAA